MLSKNSVYSTIMFNKNLSISIKFIKLKIKEDVNYTVLYIRIALLTVLLEYINLLTNNLVSSVIYAKII